VQKIPTLFTRDESTHGHPVIDAVTAGCQWVIDGEGNATRKLDGMNVKVASGLLYKRQKPKTGEYDEASYVPCRRDDPADKHLFEAFDAAVSVDLGSRLPDGVYEALGPKIHGGAEGYADHEPCLIPIVPYQVALDIEWLQGIQIERTFLGLRRFLAAHRFYGIVFHHPDGRLAKIKRKDYGLAWPTEA
jgi:hypothetical protein